MRAPASSLRFLQTAPRAKEDAEKEVVLTFLFVVDEVERQLEKLGACRAIQECSP